MAQGFLFLLCFLFQYFVTALPDQMTSCKIRNHALQGYSQFPVLEQWQADAVRHQESNLVSGWMTLAEFLWCVSVAKPRTRFHCWNPLFWANLSWLLCALKPQPALAELQQWQIMEIKLASLETAIKKNDGMLTVLFHWGLCPQWIALHRFIPSPTSEVMISLG